MKIHQNNNSQANSPQIQNKAATKKQYLPITTALLITTCLGAGLPAMTAYAAEVEDSWTLEEIIVTSRKRAERIQDTPIAVTAFSASDISARSLSSITDISGFVPNVDITSGQISGGGANSQVTIRGIGQGDFLITTDPGVGTYVDGVYFARSMGGVMDLLDLERIEVLRGPQGTLYGKNTIGGAINLISMAPSDTFAGKGEITLGRFNRMDFRGSVNIPLVEDKLFTRISFSSRNRDGYGKRVAPNPLQQMNIDRSQFGATLNTNEIDTGNENADMVRGVVRWVASEEVEVTFAADYSRERENSMVVNLVAVDPADGPLLGLYNLVGALSGLYDPATLVVPDNPFISTGTGPSINNADVYGGSVTVDWDAGDIGVKSITAYRELQVDFGTDGDFTNLPLNEPFNRVTQNQFSQELQFTGLSFDDKFNWVAGLYYFNETAIDRNTVNFASGLFNGLEALAGPLDGSPLGAPTAPGGPGNPINALLDINLDIFNEVTNNSYAAFFQGSFSLTEDLSITGGLRYTYEKKKYFLVHRRINANVFIGGSPRTVENSWKELTPKLGIEYKADDDVLLYGSYSRGFKSGGFNGRPILEDELTSFNPEYVDAFEVGVKSDLFDKRLRANLAGFYYLYKDMQLNAVTAAPNGNLVVSIDNAGKSKIMGIELELQARPAEGLDMFFNVGYTDAEYTDIGTATSISLGNEFIKTPKWNLSGSVQYSIPLDNEASVTVRGDWTYQSKVYNNVQNSEAIAQNAYSLFNARITYMPPDEAWELALFGTNLTNETYLINGGGVPGSLGYFFGMYGQPREWGVSLSYHF